MSSLFWFPNWLSKHLFHNLTAFILDLFSFQTFSWLWSAARKDGTRWFSLHYMINDQSVLCRGLLKLSIYKGFYWMFYHHYRVRVFAPKWKKGKFTILHSDKPLKGNIYIYRVWKVTLIYILYVLCVCHRLINMQYYQCLTLLWPLMGCPLLSFCSPTPMFASRETELCCV